MLVAPRSSSVAARTAGTASAPRCSLAGGCGRGGVAARLTTTLCERSAWREKESTSGTASQPAGSSSEGVRPADTPCAPEVGVEAVGVAGALPVVEGVWGASVRAVARPLEECESSRSLSGTPSRLATVWLAASVLWGHVGVRTGCEASESVVWHAEPGL
eukprot:64141-Prymnesium_polylepis.1